MSLTYACFRAMMGTSWWSSTCHQKDVRTGEWRPVHVTISRCVIIIKDAAADHVEEAGKGRDKNTYRLKNFKIEVGKCSDSNYFCLFLVTGFTKITFGFEKLELLEVKNIYN